MTFRLLVFAVLTTPACIPYSVGSTAQPVPIGETHMTFTVSALPNGFAFLDSTKAFSFPAFDIEGRYGLPDGVSDVGLRVPSMSGIIVNYKRRIVGGRDPRRAAVAFMTGGGIVNMFNHMHIEFSLIASGRDDAVFTPYIGVRGMQVVPVSDSALSDSPTAGGFLGLRIGHREFGLSPEIGVYYDRSALGIRERNVIIVPSISFHGSELIDMIMDMLGRRQ